MLEAANDEEIDVPIPEDELLDLANFKQTYLRNCSKRNLGTKVARLYFVVEMAFERLARSAL